MASPKRSTEGKFKSRCGRPYESEQDRDRHEGQCDDCIDLNHGVDPDDTLPKKASEYDPNHRDFKRIPTTRNWKSHKRQDVNIRVPADIIRRYKMDQRRYNIKWTPCSDGKLIILELVDFATYKQEPLQGG